MAKLYGIGVGPGDKELLTIKAVRTIEKCDVIVAPSAMAKGESIALNAAKDYIKEGTEVVVKHFPMGKANTNAKVKEIYDLIGEKLKEGKSVAFLTIGDAYIYSTYVHLLKYINEKGFEVETIAGIPSFCASASIANIPLVMGENSLKILPASKVEEIKDEKYVVIMKVYNNAQKALDFLEDNKFSYVYIKNAGREGEVVLTNKEDILKENGYMSLIIANRV
ncbi:cobalt-factor II C(20)-methyltransferase [Clostridium botulinum]|uniref:Cobalt-precorrin-2 C(20)-methyltransferase n=1 Tax=Clostridium botulinum C/D str. DC5 TaxID=1443128 RepID=A0A0A0IGP0_CLOBO|nr:cobalt-factor II C(20)-methyltransferase [Clostridium botulinum]KEI00349.1 cobalt-precorrin-2 C(20)-methyltransferase [Clostridium botulinum C/D str. BKT75002]KEI08970.1 cobalt-precorrin-2 C(20)-methyltransferase [Clostridium botulinum C/D str. BKT2873]KGM95987.1 cobalt-precorrin-2 C(20)-methyltransferase [Clostridium botulinum D str. CCUG 7971]KGM99441.1 cobalt-precorrin-2 C(20)-methyltransferase [Clostridium botulinum C/D str. DC5]KOC49061.1 cobalt-precorrin-2 C(20)-methyltransferase [Clo